MKEYNHKKLEKKWQNVWAKKKVYKTEDNSKKTKFYILDMFPYVSGEGIHVGHPKGYIATDVVSRMKRMQGFNVLHPMGFDAFGLPAENYAIKTKTNPVISVAKNIARFKKQLEIIGFDYDWNREVNTSDPKFYKWTQWIFLKLLEKGLAYESNEPVNWCPKDKTVLANEDVEDGKCERCGTIVEKKPIRQWVLKITDYADRLLSDLDELDWPESIKESQRNWIGRSEGVLIKFKVSRMPLDIEVFTTRADTLFGATYLVLAPEHELVAKLKNQIKNWNEVEKYVKKVKMTAEYQRTSMLVEKTGVELKGVRAVNPATKEEIPIWIADYILEHYGTGTVMGVPAHDERDFEFARKYKLPIRQVILPDLFDASNLPRPDKENTKRNTVHIILRNQGKKEVLVLFLKGEKWKGKDPRSFLIGGIEEGESAINTAMREIKEETGYINFKLVKQIPFETQATFFAAHKDVNRIAHITTFVFDLVNEEKVEITEDEYFTKDSHEMKWIAEKKVSETITIADDQMSWKYYQSGGFAYTDNGILCNSGKFNGMESQIAKTEITEFVGGKMVTKYKLRDWVFSRQRYWGEPIPILRDGNKVIPVKEKDLPLKLPKVKSYEPTGTAESPLANVPNWINVPAFVKTSAGKKVRKVLRRESNTMPQWAGSSWYYLRYMDPNNNKALVDKKKEKYWNMVDLYVGGAEHATRHLIYARFWHKFLYDIGVVANKEPFKRLQHVGQIIASDGRKMSKRWKNIVNPDDVIATFGADSFRLYEMFMGPFDQSISWNTDSMIGPRRFLERVWKIASRIQKNFAALPASGLRHGQNFPVSASLTKLLHKTIKKVSEDIESMHFNTAISALMILINEMEKNDVNLQDYEKFLQLLAPFVPHITEEIWFNLGHKDSIHLSTWPKWDENLVKDNEIKIAIQVNGKVRAETTISANESEDVIKTIALKAVEKYITGTPKRIIYVKNRLINIVL